MVENNPDLATELIKFLQTKQDNKDSNGKAEKTDKELQREIKDIYKPVSKKQLLFCHIHNRKEQEIAVVRTKIYSQDFTWKKRIYPIDATAIWYDKKGNGHIHCVANESDGTIRFLFAEQLNLISLDGEKPEHIDKCESCGGRISIDAKNVHDLIKRKTLSTFWGIDQSHILLLLIMGIIMVGAFGGLMYLLGENQKVQKQYTALLEQTIKEQNTVTAPNLLIGVLVN